MKNKKNRKPLLFKEGLGWLIIGCCAVFFCAAPVFANTSGSLNATGTSSDSTVGGESVSCDGQLSKPHGKGSQPLSVMDTIDTCAHLKEWEYMSLSPTDSLLAKQVYDTLRLYIEKCAESDQTSYQAFGHLDAAVELYNPNDTSRFTVYRDWLISVLYLNTTESAYFCNCLSSIAGTYQYSQFPLAGLAILNYIRHISACYGKGLDKEFTKDSLLAFQEGYDPTHLPPLDSLGLGFLLKNAVHPSPASPLSSQYLASFTSSPNPFKTETTLEFTLNRMTYITISVYDELGKLVWSGGKGSSLDAGTHTVQIDGAKLPSGTLYARISTGFGEVKTVKLVHEK